MSARGLLDLERPKPNFSRIAALRAVRDRHGKSYARQISEILRLRLGARKISIREYFYFRLFDDRIYDDKGRQQFVGGMAQHDIYLKTSDPDWWALAHDKLSAYALLQGMGLPVPQTIALYHPWRRHGSLPVLTTPGELAGWLRNAEHYPFFSKPVQGMWSVGSTRAESYDQATDSVIAADGRGVKIDRFVEEAGTFFQSGYLFQEVSHPHPRVAEVCGDRLGTVRVVILLTETGPTLFRCIWKIPAAKNMADNFWRSGNMLAVLDPTNGKVTRVVRGYGLNMDHPEVHPDTGKPIPGFVMPEWERLLDVVLTAAAGLPGIRFQAWDVAASDKGPILVEVNVGGDFNLPQIATGIGSFDEQFSSFLAGCSRHR
jgi:hypothetical protein